MKESLDKQITALIEWLKPPGSWESVLLVEADTWGKFTGQPVPAEHYAARFNQILKAGYGWVNLSLAGKIGNSLLLKIELPHQPSGVPADKMAINLSGPSVLVTKKQDWQVDGKNVAMPKIKVTDLRKSFGRKQVLDGISFELAPGESLVVIGGSGTGKSVLIKCILGIIPPDSGSIQIDGVEVTKLRRSEREELMRKFGMLFQGGALFDSLSVWENISFARMRDPNFSKHDARALAEEKLKSVGLAPDVAKLTPAELSGGMQKRVALARAIASNPEIIFFDEPTTGLDPIMADVINDLIISCSKALGSATLSITHDMHSATKIANRIAMLYQGKFIWEGRAQDIYHSQNPYVDQFVHGRAHGPITAETKA